MLVTVPNPDDLLDLQLFSLESLRAEHGKKAVTHLRRLAIRKIFKGLRPEEKDKKVRDWNKDKEGEYLIKF